MILYDYWRSSSAWRVRIALHFKGIAFERRVVNLIKDGGEQHTDAFRTLNPLGQVPVLVTQEKDGARTITQSMAIIGYLEETVPVPPLLPADPWLRARARQLAEIVNAGTQPLQNLTVLDHVEAQGLDREAWARHFIARGLAALEAASQETEAKFLVGDAPSIADLYLVPQLYNARRWKVDLAPYPTLVRVDATCSGLPAFVAAHPDAQSDARPAG
ncbi:MAG TPA: maleylacetoacetate isomerase [Polyangia bacterium]